jgi:hypothetical protein
MLRILVGEWKPIFRFLVADARHQGKHEYEQELRVVIHSFLTWYQEKQCAFVSLDFFE